MAGFKRALRPLRHGLSALDSREVLGLLLLLALYVSTDSLSRTLVRTPILSASRTCLEINTVDCVGQLNMVRSQE